MIYGGYFDYPTKEQKINELNNEMLSENFWNNKKEAEKKINELNYLKDLLNLATSLKNKIEANIDILNVCKEEDVDIIEESSKELSIIDKELNDVEIRLLLNNTFDQNDCIIEIHP